LGDEPTQLCRLADAIETRLCPIHEEKKNATEAFMHEKEEVLEKPRVVHQDKYDLWAKFEEDKEQIQKEKDQLLVE
jgi:hypothetical protein